MNERPEVSLCEIHTQQLEKIVAGIEEIKSMFTGTDTRRGVLMRMELMEGFKTICCRVFWIVAGTVLTILTTVGIYSMLKISGN